MLKLMMDAKGAFPKKMLRRAAFAEKHFEDDVNCSFRLWEEDPVTARPARPLENFLPCYQHFLHARLPLWGQQQSLYSMPSACLESALLFVMRQQMSCDLSITWA